MNLRQVGIFLFRFYALSHLTNLITAWTYFPGYLANMEHYHNVRNSSYEPVIEMEFRMMWARMLFEGLLAITFWCFAETLAKFLSRGISHLPLYKKFYKEKENRTPLTNREEKFGV